LSAATSCSEAVVDPGEALNFKVAALFAFTLTVILIAAAALRAWFGETGLVAGAALAGLADAHSTAVSVASLVASGKMPVGDASVPILVGLTTNSMTKIILAMTSGSKAFALRVVPGIVIVLAATWVGWLIGS